MVDRLTKVDITFPLLLIREKRKGKLYGNDVPRRQPGWTDDLQADDPVSSVRMVFEELQREAKRITTERQAAELARASAEAEARLAGGPQYQARAVGDYSGPPKYYDPAAERQKQAAAKLN